MLPGTLVQKFAKKFQNLNNSIKLPQTKDFQQTAIKKKLSVNIWDIVSDKKKTYFQRQEPIIREYEREQIPEEEHEVVNEENDAGNSRVLRSHRRSQTENGTKREGQVIQQQDAQSQQEQEQAEKSPQKDPRSRSRSRSPSSSCSAPFELKPLRMKKKPRIQNPLSRQQVSQYFTILVKNTQHISSQEQLNKYLRKKFAQDQVSRDFCYYRADYDGYLLIRDIKKELQSLRGPISKKEISRKLAKRAILHIQRNIRDKRYKFQRTIRRAMLGLDMQEFNVNVWLDKLVDQNKALLPGLNFNEYSTNSTKSILTDNSQPKQIKMHQKNRITKQQQKEQKQQKESKEQKQQKQQKQQKEQPKMMNRQTSENKKQQQHQSYKMNKQLKNLFDSVDQVPTIINPKHRSQRTSNQSKQSLPKPKIDGTKNNPLQYYVAQDDNVLEELKSEIIRKKDREKKKEMERRRISARASSSSSSSSSGSSNSYKNAKTNGKNKNKNKKHKSHHNKSNCIKIQSDDEEYKQENMSTGEEVGKKNQQDSYPEQFIKKMINKLDSIFMQFSKQLINSQSKELCLNPQILVSLYSKKGKFSISQLPSYLSILNTPAPLLQQVSKQTHLPRPLPLPVSQPSQQAAQQQLVQISPTPYMILPPTPTPSPPPSDNQQENENYEQHHQIKSNVVGNQTDALGVLENSINYFVNARGPNCSVSQIKMEVIRIVSAHPQLRANIHENQLVSWLQTYLSNREAAVYSSRLSNALAKIGNQEEWITPQYSRPYQSATPFNEVMDYKLGR